MAYTIESIGIIVKESIDEMVEILTDQIYKNLYQTKDDDALNINTFVPTIDINQLRDEDKKKLIKYADNKCIIRVADLTDNNAIKLVLETSAAYGYLDIVKFLVESGADINSTNALTYSAKHNHLEIVKFLVEKGAVINNTDALFYSAINGRIEVVKVLVSKYIETDTPIPDNCITAEETDINRVLFMYASEDKYHLFNNKIVSELTQIKNWMK